MKNLKLMLAAIVIFTLSLSTAAYAGDPKTEAKDTKAVSVTKAVVTPPATTNTYYVTRIDPMNSSLYDISTTPNPNCNDGDESPCEFTTSATLGSTVARSTVDGGIGVTVTEFQKAL